MATHHRKRDMAAFLEQDPRCEYQKGKPKPGNYHCMVLNGGKMWGSREMFFDGQWRDLQTGKVCPAKQIWGWR